MSSKNLTTRSSQKASSGISRRDLLKNLMAGVAGAALMPMASRGAPIRGLQGDDGPEVLWDVQAFNPASFQPADLPAYVGGSIVLTMEDQSNFQGALFWLDIQKPANSRPRRIPAISLYARPGKWSSLRRRQRGPWLVCLRSQLRRAPLAEPCAVPACRRRRLHQRSTGLSHQRWTDRGARHLWEPALVVLDRVRGGR